jgi:hypothetical protein
LGAKELADLIWMCTVLPFAKFINGDSSARFFRIYSSCSCDIQGFSSQYSEYDDQKEHPSSFRIDRDKRRKPNVELLQKLHTLTGIGSDPNEEKFPPRLAVTEKNQDIAWTSNENAQLSKPTHRRNLLSKNDAQEPKQDDSQISSLLPMGSSSFDDFILIASSSRRRDMLFSHLCR